MLRTFQAKRKQGFTLVELLIVIAVAAILAALAYPSYVDYVRKGKRGDAQQLLMNWSVNQEIWRSSHSSYASAADLGVPTSDHYGFSVSNVTATSYTLTADAVDGNDQNNDEAKDGTNCGTMTLDENGAKSPASCWD